MQSQRQGDEEWWGRWREMEEDGKRFSESEEKTGNMMEDRV